MARSAHSTARPGSAELQWTARWIGLPETTDGDVYFYARKAWQRTANSRTSTIHVAAQSRYSLYVNGSAVGKGPARGTRTRSYFDSYDVSPLMKPGTNWVSVAVRGSHSGSFTMAGTHPALLLQMDDGEVGTDETWEVLRASEWRSEPPFFSFQIGRMEWRDLRGTPVGWQIGADGARWQTATAIDTADLRQLRILPRDIPALQANRISPARIVSAAIVDADGEHAEDVAQLIQDENHNPIHSEFSIPVIIAGTESIVVPPPGNGAGLAILVEFPTEINGVIEIDLQGPSGTVVDIGYDEQVTSDQRLQTAPHVYRFADRYVLAERPATLTNELHERGFRFVQVVLRNFSEPVRISRIEAIDRTYPFGRSSNFHCSDPQLNRIWDASVRTLRVCATDTFVDCPLRENTLYLNDLFVESISALQAFGDGRLSKRCLLLAASQQRADGLLPAAIPYGPLPFKKGDGSDYLTFPAANLLIPQMIKEYYMQTADAELARELIPVAAKILQAISRWKNSAGLVVPPKEHWNFIDWSFQLTGHELDGRTTATLNWLYVGALETAAALAKEVDSSQPCDSWLREAEQVTAAIDRSFWEPNRRIYHEYLSGDGDQFASKLAQAVALGSQNLQNERRSALIGHLPDESILSPELFMHKAIFDALEGTDAASRGLELIRRHWGPIVESGSETIWEVTVHASGRSAFHDAGSLCHGFSTSPIGYLQRNVLGITPTAPGYKVFNINPKLGDLTSAIGSVPTPHGYIDIAVERNASRVAVEITVPPGTTGSVEGMDVLGAGTHQLELRLSPMKWRQM